MKCRCKAFYHEIVLLRVSLLTACLDLNQKPIID
jgi:hypothetical protein